MITREDESVQTISIVVPVYQGELTLESLLGEIEPLTIAQSTPGGVEFRVSEVILVHDGAIDGSETVMWALGAKFSFVTPIWLSRNFGQHPATLAGIASTNGDWVVSLDEDGQHDPRDVVRLLDVAVANDVQLVYAQPTNAAPHGRVRNFFSAVSKCLFTSFLGHGHIGEFNSFRLIQGEIARGLAAYCGHGIYLDVALSWVVARGAQCPVLLRAERGRPSAYSYRKLVHHFWQLLLTSGTAPLRLVAFIGIGSVLLGAMVSAYSLLGKLTGRVEIPGWASLVIVVSLFSGLTLFSLGILAEYLGIVVTMALGKPLYLITSRPNRRATAPMSDTLLWVVGSGGLLGSHLLRATSQRLSNARFWQTEPPHFSWTKPTKLAEELSHAVATFAAAVYANKSAWVLLWCAGKGVMSSSAAALQPEWWAWSRLLDLLGHYLAGHHGDLPGAIFLASSAGGIYSGNLGALLTEHTPPQPVSDYGTHKFRMEQALEKWVEMFPNTSCLIGRISNLYGPGQDLYKGQGIISHLSRCLIYRRPVNIYVSLDTRRDYLFADDCAHQIAASLSRLMTERPRAILKIFASEDTTSLARIVGVFFRMSKHRPLIVSRQPRSTQPTGLKLRSEVWRNMRGLRRTDLAAGIHLVHEHQLTLFRHGLLPPPS